MDSPVPQAPEPSPRTISNILERAVSGTVSGALCGTLLDLGMDWTSFDPSPQVRDFVLSPLPLVGIGLATLAGATSYGQRALQGLGQGFTFLASQTGIPNVASWIWKKIQARDEDASSAPQRDLAYEQRRAFYLGLGLAFMGAVVPPLVIERRRYRMRGDNMGYTVLEERLNLLLDVSDSAARIISRHQQNVRALNDPSKGMGTLPLGYPIPPVDNNETQQQVFLRALYQQLQRDRAVSMLSVRDILPGQYRNKPVYYIQALDPQSSTFGFITMHDGQVIEDSRRFSRVAGFMAEPFVDDAGFFILYHFSQGILNNRGRSEMYVYDVGRQVSYGPLDSSDARWNQEGSRCDPFEDGRSTTRMSFPVVGRSVDGNEALVQAQIEYAHPLGGRGILAVGEPLPLKDPHKKNPKGQ